MIAPETMALANRVATGFVQAFGHAADGVVRAPGRINLIGEHTDYNDGFVLPAAIGVETMVAWRRTDSGRIDVVALDFNDERDTIPLTEDIVQADGWRVYVRAMADQMRREAIAVPGLEVAVAGSVPRGSGLSSSASLEVALGCAMLTAARVPVDPVWLARIAQRAENDFVGMRCGIMDQLASAAGERDAALLIDCRSLAIEAVPVPPDWAVVIIQSGVVRGLVEGQYNARRAQCEQACQALGIVSLRDIDLSALEQAQSSLPSLLYRRARHVVSENVRTVAAAAAMRAGDIGALGALMMASHASMRDDFEITVPAVDELARIANEALDGTGGARMTGGGFGGAVVVVTPHTEVNRVLDEVSARYRTPNGGIPDMMVERLVPGAGAYPESLSATDGGTDDA